MTIEEIALQVSKEWQMVFGGAELDFALEVAKRAVDAERKACAKVCEDAGAYNEDDPEGWLYECAKRIMERSNAAISGAKHPID